MSEVIFL